MRHPAALLILLPAIVLVARGQAIEHGMASDTLARVGRSVITGRDLQERIELMPFEQKTREKDFASIKRKAVESLVGERLLALRAGDRWRGEEWRLEMMRSVLMKMLVRDELFRREIRDQVEISEQEVDEALRRFAARRKLLLFAQNDEKEAERFAREWQASIRSEADAESLIAGRGYRCDTVYVSFGSADPALEEAAYALDRPLTISSPVRSAFFGLVLVVLLGEEPGPAATGLPLADRREAARTLLRDRRESELQQRLVDRVLGGHTMNVDTSLFPRLVRRFQAIVAEDTLARQIPRGYRYLPGDLYQLMQDFRGELQAPLVRGTFGELRLGEFLEGLLYYDFAFPSFEITRLAASLFEMVRALTEAEIIAREGLNKGYDNSPEVQRDLRTWSSSWESRYVEYAVAETVSVDQGDVTYSLWRNNAPFIERVCVVNVREILRPDSTDAANLLRRIGEGAPMDSLAREHTLRMEWKSSGGASGWVTAGDRPEHFANAMRLKVGEIRGPVRLTEGFAILQLLGRRFVADSAKIDSLLAREADRLRSARRQTVLNQIIAREALAQDVEIYYERIDALDVSDVNMFTRRIIGFGGRINAAPFLLPRWEWVKEWDRLRRQVP